MEDKYKPKRKLRSANRLRTKKKKPTIEDIPEMVEFKKKSENGDLSKEEKVDCLRNIINATKKNNTNG